ncbi:CAP domain-containing protein [Litorisediminicola beolgyonensis]|uniref:CAP domain-containing protein n=1 Tax=Litorisediminicola beolgyonensis TaxID=1173614 RepID=A0ABW3ZP34_9RHOB
MPARFCLAASLAVTLSGCLVVPVPIPVSVSTAGSAEPVTITADDRGSALNRFREAQGLSVLGRDAKLDRAAADLARDMAQSGVFGHGGSAGATMAIRAKRHGYGFCRLAENIAKIGGGETGAIQGWIGSPGHRSNMVRRDITEYGYASADDYHVLMLGRDGC